MTIPKFADVVYANYRFQSGDIKERPCLVVDVIEAVGEIVLYLLPITSTEHSTADAIEIPEALRQRLGMQAEPCWLLTTEFNAIVWPSEHIRDDVGPVKSTTPWTRGAMPGSIVNRARAMMLARKPRPKTSKRS